MIPRPVPTISPFELLAELSSSAPPRLLDVREAEELAISRLPGVIHVRLSDLPGRAGDLDSDADWVVVCRSGMRSAQATDFLISLGFQHVRNLAGGMNGYAESVDPTLAVY